VHLSILTYLPYTGYGRLGLLGELKLYIFARRLASNLAGLRLATTRQPCSNIGAPHISEDIGP
jgi:hypothetical protein